MDPFHVFKMAYTIVLCFIIAFSAGITASRFEDVRDEVRVRRQDEIVPWHQRVWDFHQYYTTKHSNNSSWYWEELADDAKHQNLSNIQDGYDTVKIDFEFRFYGHTIRRIYLSTRGIISMSPFEEGLSSNHFIAPFYGMFDLQKGDDSAIYFESRQTKFIAEWRNVYLLNYTELGPFTFQAQVNNEGKISFVYKTIRMPDNFSVDSTEFLFGLVGSININIAGINVLVYYDPVQVFPSDISNNTVIEFIPLPTCDSLMDRQTCENSNFEFECQWCNYAKVCTDELDRYTKDWNTSRCLEEERLKMLLDSPRRRSTTSSPQPGPTSRGSTEHTWTGDETLRYLSKNFTYALSSPNPASSSSHVGTIIIIIIAVVVVGAIVAWIYYAYKYPTSKSGIWLMEHRPSKWAHLWKGRRGFSRHAEDPTTS